MPCAGTYILKAENGPITVTVTTPEQPPPVPLIVSLAALRVPLLSLDEPPIETYGRQALEEGVDLTLLDGESLLLYLTVRPQGSVADVSIVQGDLVLFDQPCRAGVVALTGEWAVYS